MRSNKEPGHLAIHQSRLYNIRTKRKLAEILDCEQSLLRKLSKDFSDYRVSMKKSKSGKLREVQEPQAGRKIIHGRLHYFLSQLKTPEYLHSGVRKKSPVTNGSYHSHKSYMLKIDIRKFFPSCTREAIFQFFLHQMKCSADVADALAGVCTFKGMIPTGSSISMDLAFWAYKIAFDRISELAKKRDLRFTLFVDDMGFSSNAAIPDEIWTRVKCELKRVKLECHPKKRKYFSKHETKIMTGVAILPSGEIAIPNRLSQSIAELRDSAPDIKSLSHEVARTLMGKISSARQIKKDAFHELRSDLVSAFHALF